MKAKLLPFLVVGLFELTSAFAQTKTITGKVTGSDDDLPLPGVSVRAKGTTIGATTNTEGIYSINIPEGVQSLVFTYIGYKPREVLIDNKEKIDIVLIAESKALSEVVVVGYGIKPIKDVNGSISKISGGKISNQPIESFDKALSGRAAGVQISSTGGMLADENSIRIRGINSISTSSLPLVVIDGIPANTRANLNILNDGHSTRFNALALINPNDIASIEVLKDAGAAVLYGSRASNGVILITTKKGQKGTTQISFDSKTSWAKASNLPKLLKGDDFNTINNEKIVNKFGAAAPIVAKDSDIDGDGKPDRTDWMKQIYRTGISYDNTLSISGGNDKATYYGSLRYTTQTGISYDNKLNSGSARINVDVTPKKWLRTGIQLSYTKSLNHGILTDRYLAGSTVSGWNAFPNVAVRNPNGSKGYNLADGYLGLGNNQTAINGSNLIQNRIYHPIAVADLQRNENTPQNFLGNAYIEFQPIPGLKFTTKYGVDYQNNFEDQYSNPLIGGLGASNSGLVQDIILNRNQWVWQNYASYDKEIASEHKISATVGAEYQYTKEQQIFAIASNFADPFFTHIIDGAYTSIDQATGDVNLSSGGDLFSNGLESYFGRLGYIFSNKYFIEGAFRADAFSAFGEKNKWGKFPSISVGWVATEENFLKENKYLNYLKLRGSYGLVGNSRGIGSYASRTLYEGSSYAALNGFASTQMGNPELKWEASKKFNIGFDANILDSRIGITADYFHTNNSDLILNAPVLYTVGVPGETSSITTNIGAMKNSGFELTLNTTNIRKKDFSWTSSLNFTYVKNKVTALIPSNNHADIISASTVASVGKPLGTYKLLRWAGVDPATGNPMFLSKEGITKVYHPETQKYTLQDGTPTSNIVSTDAVYLEGKTGNPTFYGGFDNTLTYKEFDFNFSFVYQGGNYLYNRSQAGMLSNYFQNNFNVILNRWTTPGQQTNIPRLYSADNTANQASTRFLEKGDFIRLRTVSLSYRLKNAWAERVGVTGLKLTAQIYNAFVITKYSGIDPEVNSNRNITNIATGYDDRGVPQPRTFTLGLNVTL